MSADATLWSSEAWASAPDASLLARTRDGSAEAFGELWRRHLPAAYAVANRHRGRSAAEDVVAEAAARVLALIREGRGPDENFRAYFLSAVRTVAIDQGRRELRLVPTEDDDLEELAPTPADPFAGMGVDEDGVALVRAAFAELPERDQRILWHTTVEGAAPRAVAPALGMTPNAVSVRAMRAREQLRANYLDARAARELAAADTDECRWTVSHLGAYVRGRLPKRQTERARAHVEGCPHAAALAADLRVIHDGFPALVVPVVLAAGLATPGFVTGGLVAWLSAASAGASGVGAAGAAGSTGFARSGDTPATASSQTGSTVVDVVAQAAGRATSLAAAVAVSAGLAAALSVPAPSLADTRLPRPAVTASPTGSAPAAGQSVTGRRPPAATPGATSTAPSALPSSGGSGDLRALSGIPRPVGPAGRPVGSATGSTTGGAAGGAAPGRGVPGPPRSSTPAQQTPSGAVGSTPRPPRPAATEPSPSPTPTPTTPGTPGNPPPKDPPPSDPPPSDPGSGSPTIEVRLVRDGDTARISVQVRTVAAARLTVRIGNLAGAGRLTVRNSSWECVQTDRAAVSCIGGRGSAVLDQSGAGGVVPLVVRVTDATGHAWTETIRPT